MEQLDMSKVLPEFVAADFNGVAVKPDNEAIALLFSDAASPDKLLPVIIWRPAAQKLLQHLQDWLATEPRPGQSDPATSRH